MASRQNWERVLERAGAVNFSYERGVTPATDEGLALGTDVSA
jgi:hypothetical protein